jgi:GNAT superfamily N-acetyltransferase
MTDEKNKHLKRVQYSNITIKSLTTHEWHDFLTLFSEKGVQNGCWCMYWRIKRTDFHRYWGEKNKALMKSIVESGKVPGILAYRDDKPVGWCSIASREDFPVLDRSSTLKRVDDKPVWSIVCFFVSKPYRREGMTSHLIEAALDYASGKGAGIVEAYPINPELTKDPRVERYAGQISTYEKLGFKIVSTLSERKPVMRYHLK